MFFILCDVIFLVSCRGNLKLITFGSERVKQLSSHSIKNLAVHSLFRFKDDYTTNCPYLTYTYLPKGWENVLFKLGSERVKSWLNALGKVTANLRHEKRSFWSLTWKAEGRPPRLIPAEERRKYVFDVTSVSQRLPPWRCNSVKVEKK